MGKPPSKDSKPPSTSAVQRRIVANGRPATKCGSPRLACLVCLASFVAERLADTTPCCRSPNLDNCTAICLRWEWRLNGQDSKTAELLPTHARTPGPALRRGGLQVFQGRSRGREPPYHHASPRLGKLAAISLCYLSRLSQEIVNVGFLQAVPFMTSSFPRFR